MPNPRTNQPASRAQHQSIGFALLPTMLLSAVAGCTSVPLQQDNSLSSYDGLTKVDGRIRKAEYKAVPADLNASKTVYIEPTLVSPTAAQASIKVADQALVATVVSRSLCIGVSDRFVVTNDRENADLIVHATVTRIVPTNATVAGLSTAASLGASFASSSVPVPRIPFGLGGLAVEAEATTKDGKQAGAMVWSKGANFVTTGARMSQVGDAYSLADSFGSDFSKMLVTGKTPFKFGFPKLPSYQKLKSGLGGKPKYQACERFGRAPGLKDFAGSQLGLPPSWTDKPARPQSQ